MLRHMMLFVASMVLAACVDGVETSTTAKALARGKLISLDVQTQVKGKQVASSTVVLASGDTGTVRLGLADNRKVVVTVSAREEGGHLWVGGHVGAEKMPAALASATELLEGQSVTITGAADFSDMTVFISKSGGAQEMGGAQAPAQQDLKPCSNSGGSVSPAMPPNPGCSCQCSPEAPSCCVCSSICQVCCGGGSCFDG